MIGNRGDTKGDHSLADRKCVGPLSRGWEAKKPVFFVDGEIQLLKPSSIRSLIDMICQTTNTSQYCNHSCEFIDFGLKN